MKNKSTKKMLSSALVYGTVILSGVAMKKILDFGFRKFKHQEPPKSITSDSYSVGYVLLYTFLSGSAAAGTRLLMKELVENRIS